MNKFDYKDISIITHIRVDDSSRLENFKLRNDFFRRYCVNLEFVNVEDDIERKIPESDDEIYHLTGNNGPYNKNLAYNKGFNLTKRPYVLFLDVDCVLDPSVPLKISTLNEIHSKIILAYDYVLYLKENIKENIKGNITIDKLNEIKINIDTGKDNTNSYGRLFTGSCGGAIITHRDVFKSVNGFNPFFFGWGYEDSEFRERLAILDKRMLRSVGIMMFHLPHGKHFTNRTKETLGARHNKIEYDKVIKMNKQQCEQYIKTWTL